MAIDPSSAFPTSLDSLADPGATTLMNTTDYEHHLLHQLENDAIENLQAKVGVDDSAVVTSLDYLVKKSLTVENALVKPATDSTTAFQVQQADSTNVLTVDTTNKGFQITGATSLIADAATSIPLLVKGAASQSANLFEIQDSAAANLVEVNNLGYVGIGIAASTQTALKVYKTYTTGTSTHTHTDFRGTFGYSTNSSQVALNFEARSTSGTTGSITGITGQVRYQLGSGTVDEAVGIASRVRAGLSGGTITDGYGIKVHPGIATGTITNLYGIYVDDQNVGGTSNFAIVTNDGNVVFNEGGDADTDFRVEGDTASHLFVVDAGLDAVRIGTTTNPGLIAHFATAGITFNENGIDRDFRVEALNNTNMLKVDGAFDSVLIGDNDDLGSTLGVHTFVAADIGIVIQGHASQSANLQEWQDSNAAVKSSISASGAFANTGTVTTTDGDHILSNTYSYAIEDSGDTARDAMTCDGSNNLILGDGTNFNDVQLKIMAKARAYRSAAQTIGTGAIVQVQLETESYDIGGDFDTSNYYFVSPFAAYHVIIAQAAIVDIDNADVWRVYIYVNGAAVTQSRMFASADNQDPWTPTASIEYVPATQQIDLRVYHNQGGNLALNNGAADTFLCVHLLST